MDKKLIKLIRLSQVAEAAGLPLKITLEKGWVHIGFPPKIPKTPLRLNKTEGALQKGITEVNNLINEEVARSMPSLTTAGGRDVAQRMIHILADRIAETSPAHEGEIHQASMSLTRGITRAAGESL